MTYPDVFVIVKIGDDAIGALELLGFARQFDWSSDAPLRGRPWCQNCARLMARNDRSRINWR